MLKKATRKPLFMLLAVLMMISVLAIGMTAATAAYTQLEEKDFTISNPYASVDWTTYGQYKANFHAHSTNSDGSHTTAQMVNDHYAKGFDILAMTDHDVLTRDFTNIARSANAFNNNINDGIGLVTAERVAELKAGIGRNGRGLIGVDNSNEHSNTEHVNGFWADLRIDGGIGSGRVAMMDNTIRLVEEKGGISHINHSGRFTGGAAGGTSGAAASNNPAFIKEHVDLFRKYPSCVGLEIINKMDNESRSERILWDNILMQIMPEGRPAWGFSNDDSHSLDATGYAWNVMLMPEFSQAETRISMETGAFYAVSRIDRREGINATLQNGVTATPANGTSATLYMLEQPTPSISNIKVEGNTITITGADYDIIEWIADGAVIATGNSLNISGYQDKINSYVRAQLKSTTGIAFTQPFGVEEKQPEQTSIRFGVMSDTHIGASALASLTPETRLVKAYQTFSNIDPDMDAIITVGDFTENGTLVEFNKYKEIMDEHSPAKVNLLSMGNHDNYQVNGEAGKNRFEDVFGFPATTDVVVGGYHFITISTLDRVYNTTTHAQNRGWLEARLAAAHAEDPAKPIFVFNHHTIIDTCIGSRQAQMDPANDLREIYSKYPQVITFSGHSHVSPIDPRTIWQGDYTALNLGSVYYAALDYTNPLTAGQTNNTNIGYSPLNRGESSTGMIVEVEGTKVTIRRIDMYYEKEIETPFVFDTSVDKANFPYRLEKRISESTAPAFAAADTISFTNITETGCSYTFPQAKNTSIDIPDDGAFVYTVSIAETATGTVAATARLQSNYFMVPQPQTVSFNTNTLKANTSYEINIKPISYFGKEGEALTATFRTVGPATFEAETLTLTPGTNERAINFTWYSDRADNTASSVQIAKKSAQIGVGFPADALTVEGLVGDASADKSWHKVSVSGLDLNSEYIYRVSNDKNIYSEIYEFTTGAAGDFTFIAIGDAQLTTGNQDSDSIWPDPITTTRAGWANTVNTLSTRFPTASFIMSCGDQVDASGGNETEYANLFAPVELRNIPLAPAMGNHDRHNNFDWHYNLPNVTPNGAGATLSGVDVYGNYWYTYNNALFVALNTSASPNAATVGNYIAQFDATLKAAVTANPEAKWLFVQHHKSTAAPASHQTDADVRVWTPAFNALMDKYDVDFVLAGHDHVYSRSWFIKDNAKVEGIDYSASSVTNPAGTLYFSLNSSSGLKYYDFPNNNTSGNPAWVYDITGLYYEGRNSITFTGKPWYTNIGIQVKVPQFSTVDVTEDSVTFKTYRVDTMAVIDAYTVVKDTARIENVSLQIGADETKRNFVWYSDAASPGKVQIALKSAMTGSEFPAEFEQFNATSSTAGVPQGFSTFKATASGLAANTAYVYRVGDGNSWSEIYSFKTQSFADTFSFLAAGDPQIGYRNTETETADWIASLNKSLSAFPEASFLVTLGDQVANEFSDAHYNGLLKPDILKTIPLAVVPGNHDVPSPLFAPHFNMPNLSSLGSTSQGSGDGDYWYIHNNTLFMSLNLVNTNVAQHKQFMIETLAANPDVAWTVLTVHFTLLFEQATNSGYWNITRPLRNELVPIISELGIDVVLAGHDHSYVRTHMMDGLTPVVPADGNISSVTNPPKEQVVYLNLNSSTGNIYVALSNTEQPFTAVKNQENVPNISKVDITDESLTITTYRLTDMTVVDTFTIYHTAEKTFAAEALTLQPGADATSINFNWYSDRADSAASSVQIAKKSALTGSGFPADAITISGAVGDASTGKSWHKVAVSGLEPDTEYIYRVSNDKNIYSEIYGFKSARAQAFRFAVTGDPQLTVGLQDNTSSRGNETTAKGWQDTMAAITARGVDFIAGVGDQVDITANGSEAEYANFFAPPALRSLPYAPALGNHDRHYLFNYHYNLPNAQSFEPLIGAQYGNTGNQQYADMEAAGNYWYRYNNALFVVLNDSAYPANAAAAEQIVARFDATLQAAVAAAGDYTWLFVQHHKSTASVADHLADTDIQYYVEAGFERLMDKYSVDFVLAGHDHVYARSYPQKNGVPDKSGASGAVNATLTKGGDGAASSVNTDATIYFTTTTGSGLKYYELFNNAGNLYVKNNTAYPYLVEGLYGSAAYAGANIINNNLAVENGTTDPAQYAHEVGKLPLSTAKYLQNKTPGYLYIEVDGSTATFKFYDLDEYKDIPYDTYTVTKTTEDVPVTNVSAKTLNANIVGSPTVITYVDNMDKLGSVLEDGVTTSVMVDYTTLTNAKRLLRDVANKALPIFVLHNVSEARELAALIARGYEDTHVAAADPAVLRAYRDIATKSRASLIIDRKITLNDVREIIATANTCRAMNVMVYVGQADKQTIEEIQRRFTTVWMFSDDTTVGNHVAITSGVTGVITGDPAKLQADSTIYNTSTLTRRPFIIAHRGLSSQAPENTLPAYELAHAAGADMIECDVYITKDGEIIFLHDDYFTRTTNIADVLTAEEIAATGKTVSRIMPGDLTLEQIKRFDAAAWVHTTYAPASVGGWAGLGFAGTKVPTLREIVEFMVGKDLVLVCELKDGDVAHVTPTYEVIKSVGEEMLNQVVFISFQDYEIQYMINNHPDAPTGRLTAVSANANAVTHAKNILNTVLPLNSTYNPTYTNLNQASITQLLARGLSLWPYTLNTTASVRQYIDYGISGVTTDYANRTSGAVMGISAEYDNYTVAAGEVAVINSVSLNNLGLEVNLPAELVVIEGNENVLSIDGNAITLIPGTSATVLLKAQSPEVDNCASYTLYSQPVTVNAESPVYDFTVYLESAQTELTAGDTLYVDVMLTGSLNYTQVNTAVAYDAELLEFAGYANLGGLVGEVKKAAGNQINVRSVPSLNMIAGAPCANPVRVVTLKFTVKDNFEEESIIAGLTFAAIAVTPTAGVTGATTAPGNILSVVLQK